LTNQQASIYLGNVTKYLNTALGEIFMNEQESETQESLVKRIENLANVLQDSSVGEIELTEGGTEIIIRRSAEGEEPVSTPQRQAQDAQAEVETIRDRTAEEDRSVAIVAPLTGVFYLSPSPNLPPFVKVGDIIQLEQVVALIEAMKVFNEIRTEVAGRLTQIIAEGGLIVKKGDVLFRVEPL
jgi:acetyl-CoA carboxylase biotin carboxyl carrier protein